MDEWVERVDEQDRVIAVVERAEAIRRGWLHRVATVVCRDARGRVLVHRRPENAWLFPGQYNWLLGGAVGVGESYEEAARREPAEEAGIRARPRLAFRFLCRGAVSPYWMGVHETVVDGPVTPDASEVAWWAWLTEAELRTAFEERPFVPDCRDAHRRYTALR